MHQVAAHHSAAAPPARLAVHIHRVLPRHVLVEEHTRLVQLLRRRAVEVLYGEDHLLDLFAGPVLSGDRGVEVGRLRVRVHFSD